MIIGIYGGSFDPIHTGHSIVANFVAQCGIVDEVWITINRQNPLKTKEVIASDDDRIRMAELVAKQGSNVKVCDIEMSLPSPSYTYKTLSALKVKYPEYSFRFIIGSDSYSIFKEWRNNDFILKKFGLIVYPRPGYRLPEKEPDNVIFLNGVPEFGISSSLIREYIRSGWNINYFVPIDVADYIKNKKLYI